MQADVARRMAQLDGSKVRFMRQVGRLVEEAIDDLPEWLVDCLPVVDDEGTIAAFVVMIADGPAFLVTAPGGVVKSRAFSCLEDAVEAIEGAGYAIYNPYGALVPRFSSLPLA